MNRVLTLEEVLALREGARVYVDSALHSGAVRKTHDRLYTKGYGKKWRVWSLPQPPTANELAANPWLDKHE